MDLPPNAAEEVDEAGAEGEEDEEGEEVDEDGDEGHERRVHAALPAAKDTWADLLRFLGLPPATPPARVSSYLDDLADPIVAQLYSRYWRGSKAAFAREYHVAPSSFSRWTLGKQVSMSSRRAMREYLLSLHSAGPARDSHNVCNLHELPALIAGRPNICTVVFIDGDQGVDEARKLLWFAPVPPSWWADTPWLRWVRSSSHHKQAADTLISMAAMDLHKNVAASVHFVICSHDYFAEGLAGNLQGSLHRSARVWNPRALDLAFLLMVADMDSALPSSNLVAVGVRRLLTARRQALFATEPAPAATAEFQTNLRRVLLVSPHGAAIHLSEDKVAALDELLRKSLPPRVEAPPVRPKQPSHQQALAALFDGIPEVQQLKAAVQTGERLSLNVIGQRWRWRDAMTNALASTGWHALLKRADVQAYLDAELERIDTTSWLRRRVAGGAVSAAAPSEDQRMRERFLAKWGRGRDLGDFCRDYGCDLDAFRAWLDGKRSEDLRCTSAVRRFLNAHVLP